MFTKLRLHILVNNTALRVVFMYNIKTHARQNVCDFLRCHWPNGLHTQTPNEHH